MVSCYLLALLCKPEYTLNKRLDLHHLTMKSMVRKWVHFQECICRSSQPKKQATGLTKVQLTLLHGVPRIYSMARAFQFMGYCFPYEWYKLCFTLPSLDSLKSYVLETSRDEGGCFKLLLGIYSDLFYYYLLPVLY